MRSNGFMLLFGILLTLILDLGLYVRIKQFLQTRRNRLFYWLHSAVFVAGLFCYYHYVPRLKTPETYYWIGLGIGLLFLFYIPKLIFILVSLICWPLGLSVRLLTKKAFGRLLLFPASVSLLSCTVLPAIDIITRQKPPRSAFRSSLPLSTVLK